LFKQLRHLSVIFFQHVDGIGLFDSLFGHMSLLWELRTFGRSFPPNDRRGYRRIAGNAVNSGAPAYRYRAYAVPAPINRLDKGFQAC
jgi:hypothetical protein